MARQSVKAFDATGDLFPQPAESTGAAPTPIASARRRKALVMSGFNPTEEQALGAEMYLTGESLRLEALAGTGKTTELRYLASLGSPRGGKILYTSFGSKNVRDAKAKFPSSCKVMTNHGLAFAVGGQYQRDGRLIGRLSPLELARHFGWTEDMFAPRTNLIGGAHAVIGTLNAFLQSSDTLVLPVHAIGPSRQACRGNAMAAGAMLRLLTDLAASVWQEMIAGDTLPVTHDVYLKQWALGKPRLDATTIFLDEAQDTSELMVGVLREQEHAQLVIVGDRRQSIYKWRGALDALDAFDIKNTAYMTQSFRFGPEIADFANTILSRQCGSDVLLRGDPNQPGIVGPCREPKCYLGRTNASLIGELFTIADENPGAKVGVVGGVDDLVQLVQGADRLMEGRASSHPELAEFSHWEEVRSVAENEGYAHLRKLVQFVETYGPARLESKLQSIRGNENDPEGCFAVLSTAHKAKGAEFSSVVLLDDFVPMGPPENPGLFGWTPEEGNLHYVAATRARKHLDVSLCQAVLSTAPDWYRSVPALDDDGDTDTPMAPAYLGTLDLPAGEVSGFSEAMSGFMDEGLIEGAAPSLLREGRWLHPLIPGATVDVSFDEDSHYRVVVSAMGFELFSSCGEVVHVEDNDRYAVVGVGTGELAVPFEAIVA